HIALANKLAGVDLLPANDDITANFSSTFNFYLGLDNNHGAQPDLVAVLLHEFAHGLGFSQLANLGNGALFSGLPDQYNSKLFDQTLNLFWPQMTNAQRVASATRWGRTVWAGSFVTAGVPSVLSLGSLEVRVTTPANIAGVVQFGGAAFGPTVASSTVSGNVLAAVDVAEAGGTTTDGCSPFANAAAIAGKIALIERGLCGFAVKARNATNAGAIAAIIYNNAANAAAGPPGMADDGINGAFVTIPAVSLRRTDGTDIVAALVGTVGASMGINNGIRAGADELGRVRVFAPFPVIGGSSISHYDTVAIRNLLMEPAINGDLTHKVKAPDDLTFELLRDIGWTFPDADGDGVVDDEDCNPNSDTSATIIIGGINTGVPNTLFPNGCTMSDLLTDLKDPAVNHGDYVSAVANLTNQWVADGLISGVQKGAIQSAAAKNH
ncbi:MAG TPA: PA domain-containing protein, partial [Pyrinomonadaceae bacterium]|nr:PA domain-containing protein [Pyrinomonadaceae bacterium]